MTEILQQITEEVLTGMLHLPVSFASNEQLSGPLCQCAKVEFTGADTGELRLSACFAGATVLANGLLPPGIEPDRECILDSFGEIANILAGSLKAILPAGVHQSTPEMCSCKDKSPAQTGLCRFEAGGEFFEIRVSLKNTV